MALGEAPVAATLPAVDIKRAKKFYRDVLGLKVEAKAARVVPPGALFPGGPLDAQWF